MRAGRMALADAAGIGTRMHRQRWRTSAESGAEPVGSAGGKKLLRPQRRDSLQGSSHRQPCGPIPVGAVMLITRMVDALSCIDWDGPGRVRAKRTEQSSVCLSHGVDLARLCRAQRVPADWLVDQNAASIPPLSKTVGTAEAALVAGAIRP